MRDDLAASHLQAIQALERTVDADRLDEDGIAGWLAAINDIRLVLEEPFGGGNRNVMAGGQSPLLVRASVHQIR